MTGITASLPAKASKTAIFALVAALLATPAAMAAEPGLPAGMMEFVQSAEHHNAVMALMGKEWLASAGPCAETRMENYQLMLLAPTEFAQGRPVKGGWREIGTVNGCGTRRQLNINSVVKDGAVQRFASMTGTTHADLMLQRDSIQYVVMAGAAIIPRECKDVRITNTEFLEFEGVPRTGTRPGFEPRPWAEDWTIQGCGTGAVVKVHYIPDSTGTGIRALGNETRRLGSP